MLEEKQPSYEAHTRRTTHPGQLRGPNTLQASSGALTLQATLWTTQRDVEVMDSSWAPGLYGKLRDPYSSWTAQSHGPFQFVGTGQLRCPYSLGQLRDSQTSRTAQGSLNSMGHLWTAKSPYSLGQLSGPQTS